MMERQLSQLASQRFQQLKIARFDLTQLPRRMYVVGVATSTRVGWVDLTSHRELDIIHSVQYAWRESRSGAFSVLGTSQEHRKVGDDPCSLGIGAGAE
mgnify:CR=1 FL=1